MGAMGDIGINADSKAMLMDFKYRWTLDLWCLDFDEVDTSPEFRDCAQKMQSRLICSRWMTYRCHSAGYAWINPIFPSTSAPITTLQVVFVSETTSR